MSGSVVSESYLVRVIQDLDKTMVSKGIIEEQKEGVEFTTEKFGDARLANRTNTTACHVQKS